MSVLSAWKDVYKAPEYWVRAYRQWTGRLLADVRASRLRILISFLTPFCQQVFSLLYLPSFVRTYLDVSSRRRLEDVDSAFAWALRLIDVVATPAMARFVRLCPQMAADFFVTLVEILAFRDPKTLKVSSSPICPPLLIF